MAYRADIEIAVRGAQELKRLQDQVSATSKLVDGLNSYLENIGTGGVVRSINNLNAAVANTAAIFNKAALGTEEATLAAKAYLAATNDANAGLREKANLLAQIQAKEIASQRRIVPGNAGVGQQTPALPPQLVKTYEIGQNWVQFFKDASAVAVDLKGRALNTKANWNEFFKTAAEAAVNVKANSLNTKASWNDFFTSAAQSAVSVKANSLNTKASWNDFFTSAAQSAVNVKANSLNTKASWNKFFKEAKELSAELQQSTKKGRSAAKGAGGAGGADKTKNFGLADAVIGGAFPLLFGQGPGASLGGAAGGLIGSRIGGGKGGFGGSLVGTIAGQATIDFAINSAIKLGKALEAPTSNIEDLISVLGIAGTSLKSNISVLQQLGLTSTASAIALAKLEELLGKEGFKNAEQFSKDSQKLANAFSRLQLAAANISNSALPGILDALTQVLKTGAQMGLPKGSSLDRAAEGANVISQETAKQAKAKQFIGPIPDAALQLERVAQKAITDEKQRQVNLAVAQKNLENDRLNLTRVGLASETGRIAILQLQNDLVKKQQEYTKETEAAKKSILSLDISLLQQQKAQAQAAQRNAVIEAQRAVDRQTGGLIIEQTELANELSKLESESARLIDGEEVGIASQLKSLQKRYNDEAGILLIKRDLEKLGINEVKVLNEIDTKYNALAAVLTQRLNNENELLTQQKAQYNLTQLQIDQQRELANLATEGTARLELQRTQSFQDPAGIGFFGSAIVNQKLALEEYNVTLRNYNAQLLALEESKAVPGLNPDVLLGLTQQSEALKDQIALYKEYQPAIIQARLEQEKFNAVFSATAPLVDNIVDSLNGVVSGTMTAQEAFASFLNAVSNMLVDAAKQMISQYIAIGIARMFAGLGTGLGSLGGGGGFGSFTGGSLGVGTMSLPGLEGAGALASTSAFSYAGIGMRAAGGPVTGKNPYIVGERGPELFVPGSSGTITPNHMLGGMGGNVNVVVNVDASGTEVQGNDNQAKALGGMISAAVQSELVKQKRPGGLLAGTR